jgi:peptidoglycan/xylan/chitin deacetylase (PgdA/CDA1 family)
MSVGWRAGVKAGLFAARHYHQRLARVRFPGVAVLCYHGVRPDDWRRGTMVFEGLHVRASELDAHCRLISETCHPITLDQWRASLHGGPALPPRPVLVTFDDGYRTVATVAKPILEQHAIRAVLFVCSMPIEARTLFLHDAIARHSGEAAVEAFKSSSYASWRDATRTKLAPVSANDPHAIVSVDELQVLARDGFEIGNHTSSHPMLSQSSPANQQEEIADAKAALRAWLGHSGVAFAYPFGQPSDYSPETPRILHEHGYEFAFTTTAGFAVGHPGLECPRFVMLSGISAAELAHRLAYSWHKPLASPRVPSRSRAAACVVPSKATIRTARHGI